MEEKRWKRKGNVVKQIGRIVLVFTLVLFGSRNVLAKQALPDMNVEQKTHAFERRRRVPLWEAIEAGDVIIRPANKREVTSLLGDKYVILNVHIESKVDNKRLKLDAIQGISASNHVIRPTEGLWTQEETMGKVGKPLWEVVLTKLNKGEKAEGFIAFRLENDIKEIELIATEFRPHKIVITL